MKKSLLTLLLLTTPQLNAPEHVTIPLGKHWSLELITGGLHFQNKFFELDEAHQNVIDQAKGLNPDDGAFGFILKWTTEF